MVNYPDYAAIAKKVFENAYSLKEARKRQGITKDQVERFREQIIAIENIPKVLIDSQVLRSKFLHAKCCQCDKSPFAQQIYLFINSCNGDVDKAVAKLVKFYEIKHQTPEFFAKRDVKSKEVQHTLDKCVYVSLPVTPDNCNLILHKIKSPNPKEYIFDEAVKVFIMKSEAYTYKHGPRNGTVFINDFENVCFGHIFQPSMSSIRKGLRFLQEASPLDVKHIHIINTPPFVNYFMAIVKPLLRLEMLNRIHFHPQNIDWEKFHKDFVPKSHLPSDYGGDLASIDELHEKQREDLMDLQDYFTLEEWQKNFEIDQYYDEFMEARAEKQRNEG